MKSVELCYGIDRLIIRSCSLNDGLWNIWSDDYARIV